MARIRRAPASTTLPGHSGASHARGILAPLERPLHLSRPLPGGGAALGALPQAPHLFALGRHRRGGDRRPAGGRARQPQLRLPVHVDARCRLHGDGLRHARLRARGLRIPALPARARRHLRPRNQADVRRLRRHPAGGGADPSRGLERGRPGAGRQRCRGPGSARHLRRVDPRPLRLPRSGGLRPPEKVNDRLPRVLETSPPARSATGTMPITASGNCAPVRASRSIPRR